jgi:putative peptidoglycan lipid II flippase
MKLIRSAVSVGLFTILSRFFGFFREVLQANLIGVNAVSDAVQYALRIASVFRRMFAEGAFNSAFVPMFSRILVTDGKKSAFEFAQQVITLLTLVLIVVTVLVELFLPHIIPILFPGLVRDPTRLNLVINFTYITFPFLLFISLTAFYSGILNSFDRFVIAASSPAAGNVVMILCLIYLTPYLETPGHAAAWGGLLCGIVQFLWVMIPCRKDYFKVVFQKPVLSPRVKEFLKILGPAVLGSGVVQLNIFVDMMIASYLEAGGVSYIGYADRLNQLPLSVIGIAVSTALLPMLSRQLRNKQLDEATQSQNQAIQFALFLAIPAMIGLILMAPSLIQQIYAHGEFKQSDVLPTAYTLIALASGLPAYILNKVFSTTFFSNGDSKTPMIVGAGSMMLNVILNIILIKSYKYVGLGMATAIAGWVSAAVLGVLLYRRNLFRFTKPLNRYLIRVGAAGVILVAYLIGYQPVWEAFVLEHLHSRLLILCAFLLPPFSLFALNGYIFKIYNVQDIRAYLKFNKKTNKMDNIQPLD